MRDDIKKIYLSDTYTYNGIIGFKYDETDNNRKYYIYEWYTNNGKIFYVGKGTGSRYKHILKEIEIYEKNHKKYKGKNYKILKDTFGIDYSIIMSGLTECEALIMENYYIIKRLSERQPLLNQITTCLPDEIERWWYNVHYSGNLLDYFK